MTTVRALLAFAVAALAAAAAPAADLNINNRGDEKKFIESLVTDAIKVARGSPKDPAYVSHTADTTTKDRLKWKIIGTYKGSLTGKVFECELLVSIDTANPKKWEVLSLEYTDNNKTAPAGPSKSGIDKLKTTLNK